MRYGIVVCSKCKNARIVDLSYKTTKCVKCGYLLKLEKFKIFYESDSQVRLREILGLFNAEK